MRFMVDECTGPAVARWLRQQNHDVFSVYEQAGEWKTIESSKKRLTKTGF
jgi:uncharacterized protein with PIN domain